MTSRGTPARTKPRVSRWLQIRPLEVPQALLLAAAIVAFNWFTTPLVPKNGGRDSDGVFYAAMAGDPEVRPEIALTAPFCFRVVSPWLAARMPGESIVQRFEHLALVNVLLLLPLVYGTLRKLGFEHSWALLGMLLHGAVFWTVKFSLYSPCYVDDLTQVLTWLLLLCTAMEWWWLCPPLLFAACFQKESLALMAPVTLLYFLKARGPRWRPLLPLAALLAAAPVAAYLVLRSEVQAINDYTAWSHFLANVELLWTRGYAVKMLAECFSGLGILPLLWLTRFRAGGAYLGREHYWLPMLGLGSVFLFGGADKARLFLHVLPAFLAVGLTVLRRIRSEIGAGRTAPWLAVVVLLQLYLGNHLMPLGNFDEYLDNLVPTHGPSGGRGGLFRAFVVSAIYLVATYALRIGFRERHGNRG